MKSSKSELQKLSEWLNAERSEFPWSAVQGFASYWRDRKVLYPVAAILKKAPCSCDSGDLEEIEYDKAGKPYIMCSRTGHIRFLEKEELRYWSFGGEVLAAILSGLLECKGRPQELIPAKLWKLGQTARHLGGQPRDVYFALRMTSDAGSIYEKLPKDSSRAVLIVGSSNHRASDHFPADKIFCVADILWLEPTGLVLNRESMDLMLGGIPKPEKRKANAGDRSKYVAQVKKAVYEYLKSAYYFYTQGAGKRGEEYKRLTLQLIADEVGCAKTTVRSILKAKDENGKAKYKELVECMWKYGQDRSGIIRYGDASFPSVKGYDD